MVHSPLIIWICSFLGMSHVHGFLSLNPSRFSARLSGRHASTPDSSSNHERNNDNNSDLNQTIVTRDMILQDMLQEPVVKRKKKGLSYKVLDNRDSLPFQVEIDSPDPYTSKEKKRKNMNKVKRIPNAVENTIQSSLFDAESSNEDGHQTPLGDFLLDKHTTTGDLLEIGGIQYKVVRHKCQYKVRG